MRKQHVAEAARGRDLRRRAIGGHMQIEMFGEKPRGLREFPGIVGSPVDHDGRALRADQIEGLEPDLVVHQHAEDQIRTKARHAIEQSEVKVGKIAIQRAIPRIEKADFVPQPLERRDEVDIIVILAAFRLAIGIAAQHAQDFHGSGSALTDRRHVIADRKPLLAIKAVQ